MGTNRLSRLIFGRRKARIPRKKKDAISQVMRAVERAELRANTYFHRSDEYHAKAQEALAHSNETEAKTHLDSWNYNKTLGNMYLQVQTNLQQQLDVMQETEDLKIFANAFETSQTLMKREAPEISVRPGLDARAQFKMC